MNTVSRRVFLAALLVAAVAVAFASAACTDGCATCVGSICTSCKSGYFYGADGCTPCDTPHCEHCQAVGWCISCESGYKLQYVTDSTDPEINKYGKCVNAASFVSAHSALIAAAAALAYAVVA